MSFTVLTVVGSIRNDSTNLKLAHALAELAPEDIDVKIVSGKELAALPFYDEDIENAGVAPQEVAELREAANQADALLIVTPEYNATLPAVVKNAIDWLSRPFGSGALKGLPAAVVGTSMGQYGGVWAHDHGRLALKIAGADVVDEPRLELGHVHKRFADAEPKDDIEVRESGVSVLKALAKAAEAATAAVAGLPDSGPRGGDRRDLAGHHPSGNGGRGPQAAARCNTAAKASNCTSVPERPINWTDMEYPSGVHQTGTVMAGSPETFTMDVYGV
jgi:NAD(P)H-dependent FMN reductase